LETDRKPEFRVRARVRDASERKGRLRKEDESKESRRMVEKEYEPMNPNE
jgi:hypothetical protein